MTDVDTLVKSIYGADAIAPTLATPDTAQAQADVKTATEKQASSLNANIGSIYLTGFNNWAALVLAGKIPNTSPPQPPTGYQAVTSSNGWTWIVPGTSAVVAMPPIPQVPTVPSGQHVLIGAHIAGTLNFWAALPGNNVPANYQTPPNTMSQDGVPGTYLWVEYPFGGWWEKIA